MPAPEIISKLVQQFIENREIDALVYALYGLTDEEIRIKERVLQTTRSLIIYNSLHRKGVWQ
ncbi:MAG: hypothetical protein ABIG43_06460 [Chloroflexota bacterium]